MEWNVWILLIFAGLFLITDVAMFVKMVSLLKKCKDDTVKGLGNKLIPYLHATGVLSVLMAICMILATVMK